MLTITYKEVEETIKIGELFDQLDIASIAQYDKDGDQFINSRWHIEVQSFDAFYRIEGFRKTKPEKMVQLETVTNDFFIHNNGDASPLLCSPEHIIGKICNNELHWVKVSELKMGDIIQSTDSAKVMRRVLNVIELNREEHLYDFQVDIAHSYYTNGILSHNSHFLTHLGATSLRLGKNVLHYTFELSETAIGIRYDSNLCDMDSNTVIDEKDSVLEKYKDMKLGKLIIKEFPTGTATIYTLRAHIERLATKGFRPDMIIIDYADIMRSTRQYDSLRHELKLIYEELRGLATELKIPVWTASQSNKEGADSDVIDLTNMSEAYGKAMTADIIVSISRRSHEKATGWGRLFVAKNRAGRDGLLFPIKIDTARSKFEIVGENETFNSDNENSSTKKAIREKWQELQKEKNLNLQSPIKRNEEQEL